MYTIYSMPTPKNMPQELMSSVSEKKSDVVGCLKQDKVGCLGGESSNMVGPHSRVL